MHVKRVWGTEISSYWCRDYNHASIWMTYPLWYVQIAGPYEAYQLVLAIRTDLLDSRCWILAGAPEDRH
jgi:hypothetical protein